MIFAFFSMFFRSFFQATFWKAKKSQKNAQQDSRGLILGRPGGMRGLLGREMGGGRRLKM